ncbi:hypothetical protein Scep_015201 [Stephania cephalantha]|uniref:Uncharacterized protein n=1 Tax=Stephania cephalantha TaxID=152367 RepID=A0AAP0P2K5_9MAGN
MVHASSSLPRLFFLFADSPKKKEKTTTPRPPSSISSSSSSPIRLLHRRIATAVFADSPKEQGQNRSPLFADSPIRLLHRFSSPIRDLSACKNTSQLHAPHHTEEAFVAPIRQSVMRVSRRRSQISCARQTIGWIYA